MVHSLGFAHSAHPLPTRIPVSQPLSTLSPPLGLVGLSLSYALSLTGLLSGLVSSFTQTEAMLVSVERLEEYSSDLPQEPRGQRPQVACSPTPACAPAPWRTPSSSLCAPHQLFSTRVASLVIFPFYGPVPRPS